MEADTAAAEERSPERLVFFSDAVVAIALTLLVLPLADAVPDAVAARTPSVTLITENWWKILSFVLSFAVIGRLWLTHHRLYAHVKAYNGALSVANFGWLLAIVVLPFPTEMVGGYGQDRFTMAFYVGTILASSVCLSAMTIIVRRTPGLAKDDTEAERPLSRAVLPTALLAVAFVLVVLVPALSYYPLLLLAAGGLTERLIERAFRSRRAAR